MITKIKRSNLADKAYESIKADVFEGKMREGDKLPSENQLTKSLGVSRVVVRDALERLRKEHYIITYHGRGSFIANPSNYVYRDEEDSKLTYKEFCDIMEFRSAIEDAAIKRCISDANENEINEILSIAKKMENAQNDVMLFTSLDYEFHLQIAKASHNSAFVDAIQLQKTKVFVCLEMMNKLNDSRSWGASVHKKIAEAILSRDKKSALEILNRNEEYNIARISEIFKKRAKMQGRTIKKGD